MAHTNIKKIAKLLVRSSETLFNFFYILNFFQLYFAVLQNNKFLNKKIYLRVLQAK